MPRLISSAQKNERPVGGPATRALGMEGTVVEPGWAGPDHNRNFALAGFKRR